jgi:succinate dehydrogenase cytochrome b556 subunit
MPDLSPQGVRLQDQRPLSPHLQIYGPMLTVMMSIAHRVTGAALYVGVLLVGWYLIAAATSEGAFAQAYGGFSVRRIRFAQIGHLARPLLHSGRLSHVGQRR